MVLVGGHANAFTFRAQNRSIDFPAATQASSWLFDGYYWRKLGDMSVSRDGPACGQIDLPNGQTGVLAAGGCRQKCDPQRPRPLRSAEILDLESGSWRKVADLPLRLMKAHIETFDGFPTIIGGRSERAEGNLDLYQFKNERWVKHPRTRLNSPMQAGTIFEIPHKMFNYC